VTVRHRGGGHARRIRIVDFARSAPGEQVVQRIEYDPNRSAHVALLESRESGEKSYIVAAVGMREGQVVQSFRAGIPRSLMDEMGGRIDPGVLASRICVRGNCLPIRLVPPGTQVYNVGSDPNRGAVFCRSAGTYATVVGKDSSTREFRFMVVKLSSGEVRRVSKDACATIGVVSNPMWQFRQLGKAGRSRWLGKRPSVRGVAMNACELLAHKS
jgi:ribosomal protein L2